MLKRMVLLFLLMACSSQAVPNRQSFNGQWRFQRGDCSNAQNVDFNDSDWRLLDLPHDWAIEGPFDSKYNARCGGLPFHGIGWYRKHFKMPPAAQGKRVYIDFDGAMNNAQVWINGHYLGFHPYGYTGFRFDLTGHLRYDEQPNILAVKLAPEDLSSRWYPGAGLYRNVWLEINESVHIDHWGVFVTTPKVTAEKAQVRVQVDVKNTRSESSQSMIKTVLLDPDGHEVAQAQESCTVAVASVQTVTLDLYVSQPQRWDIHHPVLYQAVTRVVDSQEVLDTKTTAFGIRTIEYSAQEGFKLNGRPVRFNGVCLHHDHGPLGAAVNRRATERQLEIMKAMGVNAIRTSHNPPSPEQLEFCDKLGLLVQDEAFDCWEMAKIPNGYNKFFKEWHERDLRGMIRRDRNHPSVIMWSIGNEILEQGRKDGWKLARHLTAICHDEDSSRPVSAGFNNYPGSVKNGLAREVDIPGFNYKPLNYGEVLEQHPDWIIAATETSSCVSSRDVYHLPIEKYKTHPSLQVTSYDLIGPPWAYPPDIEFGALEKNPKVLGEFIWTGFDYLGEPTPYGGRDNSTNGYWNEDWPVHSSYFGAVDLCGFPKDRYFLYQSQWTDQSMIHLLPHWNWQGHEDESIPVYCYTNCDAAELIVNGQSLGMRVKGVDTTPLKVAFSRWQGGDFESKYRLRWNVPYQPGSIKVVGYRQGQPVCEKEIHTASAPAKVTLIPDRRHINGDGKDLCFITVRIEDREGHLCPSADTQVQFRVQGVGTIEAVGNGNPASLESFQSNRIKAFSGQCLLIVRSHPPQAGVIRIEAKASGLRSCTVMVTVNKTVSLVYPETLPQMRFGIQ